MKLIKLLPIAIAAAVTITPLFAKEEEDEKALLAEASVSKGDAQTTALASVPKGEVKESELEKEDGKLVWSFDISTPGTKDITEVQVDAKTGKIVATEVESKSDQAKEKAEDKKD